MEVNQVIHLQDLLVDRAKGLSSKVMKDLEERYYVDLTNTVSELSTLSLMIAAMHREPSTLVVDGQFLILK